MAYQFKNNASYSFSVFPSAVLGNNYNGVTVLAVMGYEAARAFSDVDAIQANVYPYLPPNTPNRPEDYEYIYIQTTNGQRTVLARQWIDEETITEVGNSRALVTIENVGSADLEAIRAALSQNGFEYFDIRIVSVES